MFYRIKLPLEQLAEHGHDVTLASADIQKGPGITASTMAGHDVIVAQRFNKPGGVHIWREARTPATRLVYEVDDDVFHITPENFQAYSMWQRPDILDAATHAMEVADLVTCTTQPLAEILSEYNPNVVILPNHIPAWVCDFERNRRDRPAVGWTGGASHGIDVGLIVSPVRRFLKRFPGWDLRLAGTDYRPTFKAGSRAVFSKWVHITDDARGFYTTPDWDIGLAPVAPSVFNASKCIDSSMRISTNRGMLEAGSLEPGMKVWRDGWRIIEATEKNPRRPGLLITMDGGYQLKLTVEHRMLVNGEWVQASAIVPGDRIAMEAESIGPMTSVQVPWPGDSRMSRAGKKHTFDPHAFLSATDGPRLEITPRWGRILGAYVGDGSCGQSTQIQISCDGQDQDWIDLLTTDFSAVGLNVSTEDIATYDGTVLRRRGVRVASAHLLRVLESLGLARPRPNGHLIRVTRVPEVIWQSPREVIAEFLAGYFEADGHCTQTGVECISKDEQLIRDVQRLLLGFGITSTVRSQIYRAQNGFSGMYWKCRLRRAETDLFAKHIGFRSGRKSAQLAQVTGKPHSNAYRPITWSREVTSIESYMVTPIDIQVEGNTFVLAGFVSHNSNLKALEYAALGIPVVASDWYPYRDFIRHGETGFLVKQDHEWLKYMSELAADEVLREKMGAAARELARKWTIEEGWQMWADAYEGLFRR